MGFFSTISKYILFIFNLLITVCAAILIGLGVACLVNESHGIRVFGDFSTGGFAVGIGVVIFLIATFGCCGAIKANACLLNTYAIVLLAILITQIVLGIVAFVKIRNEQGFRTEVHQLVQKLFERNNSQSVDNFQIAFKCCGVDGPSDYPNRYPKSCCPGTESPCLKPYQTGCSNSFSDKFLSSMHTLGYVAIALALIELIGAICAFCIKRKNQEYV